ncbi:integrase, partial [Calderihabitans maritimus]
EQANEFLTQYIDKFNALFAVEAKETVSVYRPIPENIDIAHILCVKHKRSVDNGGIFSFHNRHFKVICDDVNPIPPRAKVDVLVSPVFGVKVQYNDTVFDTLPFAKPKKRVQKTESTPKKEKKTYRPPDTHYYK